MTVLTTERRLGPGAPLRTGSRAAYRAVVEMAGEPHLVRTDLVGDQPSGSVTSRHAIACFAHLTDLHVTDVQSPARFEFVNREWNDPRFRELLTMQRPHEALTMHAIAAMVRRVNSIAAGPVTGARIQVAAITGDAIDNTQRNELTNFLALVNGGVVHPDSGSPGYEGVQSAGWPQDIYWKPDGPKDGDLFQRDLGYPSRSGLLERAMEPFPSDGLRVPWLWCYGNHEQVCQGVGLVTPALARAMTGSLKPVALPDGFDKDGAVESFVQHPESFMGGKSIMVSPDPERRSMSRTEFMDAYQVHDIGGVRFIALDTVCQAGGADGSIDAAQLDWLEAKLEQAGDRYVVVLSHHTYETLFNPRAAPRADELLALLLRFEQVVLWLNGHIHGNRITPRLRAQSKGGLWEVTTSALVDWPCQARLVELFQVDQGQLGIACTMVDHDGAGLAGLHRELAGNAPMYGFDSWRAGTPADRNVILLLPDPCCA